MKSKGSILCEVIAIIVILCIMIMVLLPWLQSARTSALASKAEREVPSTLNTTLITSSVVSWNSSLRAGTYSTVGIVTIEYDEHHYIILNKMRSLATSMIHSHSCPCMPPVEQQQKESE